MFEQQSIVVERGADFETEVCALEQMLHPMAGATVAPQNTGFQFPRRIWLAMFACYATFFIAIAIATGGSGPARFAIIISVLYTAIYFGVARFAARQAGPEARSPLDQGKMLDTWTGPMDKESVYGQVLIVPFAVSLFGLAILVIALSTGVGR